MPSAASARCAWAPRPRRRCPRTVPRVEALRERLGEGSGADVVVEAVGRPAAWRMAVTLARPGGEVVFHGGCPAGSALDLPAGPIHYSELTLRGSYHHTPDAFREAVASIAEDPSMVAELLHDPIRLDEVPGVLVASRGAKHPVMPHADH